MKEGDLVVPRIPWGMNSNRVGLIIEKSTEHGCWLVLWTKIGGYQIQRHLDDALLIVAERQS